jgi:ABC-type Fe3+/spermidine/putrescine transport system ATPase subunit
LERQRRIREMLDLFGLAERASRRPRELSGGEQQRTSIARALITQPQLLLLDEPVRGLDYPLRADFYDILRNIRERYRIPILLVTHDAAEGFLLGDRMAVYGTGSIVQEGEPEVIFHRPQSPAVARLLGIANIFSGIVEELDPMKNHSRLRTPWFSVSVPYLPGRLRGDSVSFCIPKEHVLLVPNGSSAEKSTLGNSRPWESNINRVAVRIVEETLTPATVRLRLVFRGPEDHGNPPGETSFIEAEVTRQTYHKMKLAQEKDWLAELPAGSIHIFAKQAGST